MESGENRGQVKPLGTLDLTRELTSGYSTEDTLVGVLRLNGVKELL